tara:strand:+ start:5096 stop:6055 length:960 start_codon:yes stop_codon:yes gene_type:complete
MVKKYKISLITKCITVVLLFFSCNTKSGFKGKIGMTCLDLTNPFFKLIANVMQLEAKKYGYELIALSGNQDPATQNNQITDFVAQEYDAIFLNPVDSKSAGEGVKKAYSAGIPVFTFDIQVTDDDAKKLIISHIGSDNYQGGRLAGESMIKATGDKGKIAILSFPEITSCQFRVNGFRDILIENNSSLQIVTELSARGNRNDGFSVTNDILQAHPDIVGIFAINDPSALGAYAAIQKTGKVDQITIVGFDASPAGKQAVFEKILYDSPQQFPRKMATGTVDAFIAYSEGRKVSKNNFIDCKHYYYNDSIKDSNRVKEQW